MLESQRQQWAKEELYKAKTYGQMGMKYTPTGNLSMSERDHINHENTMSKAFSSHKSSSTTPIPDAYHGAMPDFVFYILKIIGVVMLLSLTGSAALMITGAILFIAYLIYSNSSSKSEDKPTRMQEHRAKQKHLARRASYLDYIQKFNEKNGIEGGKDGLKA